MGVGFLTRIFLVLAVGWVCFVGALGSRRQGSPPLAPASLTAYGDYAQVELSWASSSGATSYAVLRLNPATGNYDTVLSSTANTFYADNTLDYGQTWSYQVTASNSYGTSGPSPIATATTRQAPEFIALAASGNGRVTLSWPAYPQLSALRIFRGPAAGGPWTYIGLTYAHAYVDTTVTNGTPYWYRVYAANGWLSRSVAATPHYTSVPIDIVPNPPLGFLPDPMTFPTWMENVAPTDAPDAPGGDTETASGGPSSALSVNLAHGVVDVGSGPDLVASNPTGPDVAFERHYRSAMAAGNLSSPGLPPGWTHNWDFRLVPLAPGAWGGLQLVYPNGASELLSPVLDGNGNPTGAFNAAAGAPYIASGTPSATTGLWSQVIVQHNGLAREVFALPSGDTVYRLQTQIASNGSPVNLSYVNGALTQIDNAAGGGSPSMVLTLSYGSGGLLGTLTDLGTGYARSYSYVSNEISTVSAIGNSTPEWYYSYTTLGGQPYIQSLTTRDPQGNLQTAVVAYDPATGRANLLTDAKGNQRSYGYSDAGSSLVGIANSVGNPDAYQSLYDPSGKTVGSENAANDTTTLQYGSADPSLVTSVQPPLGNAATVDADSHGNPTRVTTPYGNYRVITWEYPAYAPLGHVLKVQEFGNDQGATYKQPTLYTYYTSNGTGGIVGYLQSVENPNGGVTTFSYTSLGDIQVITGPSTSLTYSYTDVGAERYGLPSSVKDALNNRTNFLYDSNGRLTDISDPMGQTAHVGYNSYGQPVNQILNQNQTLQRAYQLAYNVPGKASVGASLTGWGSLGAATFDAEASPTTTTDANGNGNTLVSDSQFGLSQLTNGNGGIAHKFVPTPFSRQFTLFAGTGSRGLSVTTTFDHNSNITNAIGTDGKSWTVTPAQVTAPDVVGSVQSSGFSLPPQGVILGSPTTLFGHNGTVFTHDALGRVLTASTSTQAWYQPNAADTVVHTYSWDDEDNKLSDTIVTTAVSSDPDRAVTYGTTTSTAVYTYDLDGTVATMYIGSHGSTALGAFYMYTYDADARLQSVAVFKGDVHGNLVSHTAVASASYSYDADSRVQAVRTPKATILYTYDGLGQLIKLQNLTADNTTLPNTPTAYLVTDPYNGSQHTQLSSFTNIGYDVLGDRTSMSVNAITYDTASGYLVYSGPASWGYDAGGRLTSEAWNVGYGPAGQNNQTPCFVVNFGYQYDQADNLTNPIRAQTGQADFTFDASTNQITNTGYPWYDASGNDCGYIALHDCSNQNVGWDDPNYGNQYEGYYWGYLNLYDDTGNRVLRQYEGVDPYDPGLMTQAFTYDLADRMVYRSNTDSSRNVNDQYTDLSTTSTEIYNLWGPSGLVMEFDLSGHALAYTFDPNGSIIAMAGGAPQYTAQPPTFYDAYGRTSSNETVYYAWQPFRYKGQVGYYEEWHSLGDQPIYCQHRYYSPVLCRWLERDPIGLDGGVNCYAYCNGNPIMFADPSGLGPVGSPGFWESLIPVWGSGRESINYFQTGHPWKGIGWGLMAITDLFLVKDLVVIGGKLAAKGSVVLVGRAMGTAGKGAEAVKVAIISKRLANVVEGARGAELTANQWRAVQRTPELYSIFQGERIDTAVKTAAQGDKLLKLLGLQTTGRGVYGPDFYLIGHRIWWDVTTAGQWAAHVRKYTPTHGLQGILLGH